MSVPKEALGNVRSKWTTFNHTDMDKVEKKEHTHTYDHVLARPLHEWKDLGLEAVTQHIQKLLRSNQGIAVGMQNPDPQTVGWGDMIATQ